MPHIPYLGEVAGVSASLAWTLCGLAFAFAGRRIGALAVSQIRICAAVVILAAVHAIAHGTPWPVASTRQWGMLAASGMAGLALGDLFYFHSIAVLGPRLGALLMATAPLFSALLAWPVLGEGLGFLAVVGIGLTAGGVAVVLADPRGERAWRANPLAGSRRMAMGAGLLGAVGQAVGLVLAKHGMFVHATGETAVSPLPATLIRMIAGMGCVFVISAMRGHTRATLRALNDRPAMSATGIGVVFGPTLGVWLSLIALRNTDAGVAAALCALPPILMIPVARIAYGARPSRIALLGTVVAVAGTVLLFLRAPSPS